jgi:intermediate filament protein if
MTVDKQSGYSNMTPDNYRMVTTTGVEQVKSSREQEKKDMQDLNDRFANYIDKVRYLESQNKKLADDLGKLREKWGKETAQIKAMFQADLDEARRNLDDAEKEKARLEIRATSLEDQIEELRQLLVEASKESAEYKERINLQNQMLSDYQSEITSLRKRIANLEDDCDKDKKMIETLTDALAKARMDLDEVTLGHIDAENRRQTLEEEIEFLKSVHEQEMKELAALACQDSSAENRDYWKNELQNAIREIERMYQDKMDSMRTELESHYNFKVQEFKTGAVRQNMESTKNKEDCTRMRTDVQDMRDRLNDLNAKNAELLRLLEQMRRSKDDWERNLEDENNGLRGDIANVRAELEAILRQLQLIMDSKMGLELEIAAYRKLLEGEETRISSRSTMESLQYGGGSHDLHSSHRDESMSSLAKGEMSARTTYQRSAKGPITISDCPPDGKFVRIENTGRKDENIEGWKLKRTVDNKDIPEYTLDQRCANLRPGAKITIYAKGQKPSSAPYSDYECNMDSWGIGAQATTKLINQEGEDRATHVMRTVYSS